jgi:hypothetical protein
VAVANRPAGAQAGEARCLTFMSDQEADFARGAPLDGRTQAVAALLHEAAETHHQVFRITNGNDPDWASWYAEWLIDLSELPDLIGVMPVRSELIYLLVRLDNEYLREPAAMSWEEYYSRQLIDHFVG